jgi:hypothetical protein
MANSFPWNGREKWLKNEQTAETKNTQGSLLYESPKKWTLETFFKC